MPTLVYLPSGYSSARRYAVGLLPPRPAGESSSYQQNAFVAAALASAGEQAIVVAPQGARDPDADREYLDWGPRRTGRRRSPGTCRRASTAAFGRSHRATAARSWACRPAATER